jgi:hypothetical protein
MSASRSGIVHGKLIELDAPVPDLEGRRVIVTVEPIDEPATASGELASAWTAWVSNGPDGPIANDEEPELP